MNSETLVVTGTIEAPPVGVVNTASPIDFGNVHVNSNQIQAISVSNIAPAGASFLDAFGGGGIGAATEYGGVVLLAPGDTNDTGLQARLNTGIDGVQTGTVYLNYQADGGAGPEGYLGGAGVVVTGTVYALAAPQLPIGALNFGEVRVGGTLAAKSVSIADGSKADAYQESLVWGVSPPSGFVSVGSTGGTIASGHSATVALDLSTGSAGAITGTAALSLTSTGAGTSGLADTVLSGQTIALSGTVFAEASAQLATSLDFGIVHVGDSVAQAVTITNAGSAGGFTENLDARFAHATGAASAAGTVSELAAGATDSADLSIGLNTRHAGTVSGTAVLGLKSDGAGIDTLGSIALAAQTIAVTGTVDNYAVAKITEISGGGTLSGSGTAYTLNLGTLNIWSAAQSVVLGVQNAATGQADLLEGSFAIQPPAGADPFGGSGTTPFGGVAAGQVASGPSIMLNTGTVGSFAETVVLTGTGYNAGGYSGVLAAQTVTVTGTVQPYVVLTRTPTRISGGPGNGTVIATSGVLYSGDQIAPAGSNTLVAQGAGNFDLRAPAALSGIQTVDVTGAAAGQAQVVLHAQRAGPDAGRAGQRQRDGHRRGGQQRDGAGDGGGSPGGDGLRRRQQHAGDHHGRHGGAEQCGRQPDGRSGVGRHADGGQTVNRDHRRRQRHLDRRQRHPARGAVDRARGASNTLLLQGAGLFDLRGPAALSGIQTLDVTGAAAGQGQIVWLRAGLDLTLNVQDGAGVTVFGAANADTINLGSGSALVHLGSAGETVNGGSGSDGYYVTAATVGATITGGSGTNRLEVTGGGSLTMGGNIAGMQAVFLDNAASYDFSANTTAGLVIHAGGGGDTIAVGAASQAVFGSAGALTVQAAAAEAGVLIKVGSGGAALEITSGGTATLNAADTNLSVTLDAATNLQLGTLGFITVTGAAAGGDTIRAGGANQTLVSTGGNDTLVGSAKFGDTFEGSSAGLAGDVIKGFGGSDVIDITDMIAGSVQPLAFNAVTGVLTVADGTHSVSLTFAGGSYTDGSFATPVSDGHGGTLIRFV